MRIYIILLWTLAFGFSLLKAIHIEIVNYNDVSVCASSMSNLYERIFAIVFLIVAFFIPYSLIITTSILIIKFLRNWTRKSEILMMISNNITSRKTLSQNIDDEPSERFVTENSYFNSRKTVSSLNRTRTMYFSNRKWMIKRTTKFILGIVISFLCCWSPLWTIQLLLLFTQTDSNILLVLTNISFIIVYLGGIINPLLFLILTKNFKFKKAKKVIKNESN